MKTYSLDDLRVVKTRNNNEIVYVICKKNNLFQTYTDVLTGEKVKPIYPVEPLSHYYSIDEKFDYRTGKYIRLTKSDILKKYQEINESKRKIEQEKEIKKEEKIKQEEPKVLTSVELKEEPKKVISSKEIDKEAELEIAVQDFFPKTGEWTSNCFQRPRELHMCNLESNLRNDKWLAQMIKKQCNLDNVNYYDILDFVKKSPIFQELRHNYELEVVRWQIEWIKNGGENWICDEELGGDFTMLSPVCDLGIRKGVVDTLLAIGMDEEVIEEGLEKYADIWRDRFISSAFFNKYNCFTFLADPNVPIPEIDKEHESAWIRYRKYEYYRAHKKSVDKYGTPDEDMLMSQDEAIRLKVYLDVKDKERKEQIRKYKMEAYGRGRSMSLWG